jgi:hypothetical protein
MMWDVIRCIAGTLMPHPLGRMSTMLGIMRQELFSPRSPALACATQAHFKEWIYSHSGRILDKQTILEAAHLLDKVVSDRL